MSGVPGRPALRQLLLDFYQRHDPGVLASGFDLSGLVEFTVENGIPRLNQLLKKKYNAELDVTADMGDARDKFMRMSANLTISAKISQKETEYRMKLMQFFAEHDAEMNQRSKEDIFNKLVSFAMLNGLPRLNEKLKARYNGACIPIDGVTEQKIAPDHPDEQVEFGASGLNPFNLNKDKLRKDLEMFFVEMEDDQQLDMLEEMTDWACQIGIEDFDEKMDQMYGTSLNEFLRQKRRPEHKNNSNVNSKSKSIKDNNSKSGKDVIEMEEYWVDEAVEEVHEIKERAFEEMTDEEITAELTEFYMEHDPDNLEKLPQVLVLCRNLGREKLNAKLMEIYDQPLEPIPIKETKMITKKVKKTRPKPESNQTVPKPKVDVTPMLDHDEKPRSQFAQLQSEYNYNDHVSSPMPPGLNQAVTYNSKLNTMPPGLPQMAAQSAMNMQKGSVIIQKKSSFAAKLLDDDERAVPEFLRKQKLMQKRIQDGEALVTGRNGEKITVNLLVPICKKYKLDPMGGVCALCGFPKKDHSYESRF